MDMRNEQYAIYGRIKKNLIKQILMGNTTILDKYIKIKMMKITTSLKNNIRTRMKRGGWPFEIA